VEAWLLRIAGSSWDALSIVLQNTDVGTGRANGGMLRHPPFRTHHAAAVEQGQEDLVAEQLIVLIGKPHFKNDRGESGSDSAAIAAKRPVQQALDQLVR
jgi:hypothetical protein